MRLSVLAIALAGLTVASGVPASAENDVVKAVRRTAASRAATAEAYRPGEVIVGFEEATADREVERVLRAGGAREARRSRSGRRVLVTLPPDVSVQDAVRAYSREPGVSYAEPNGIVRKSEGTTFAPDDRFYRFQWNLKLMDAERTWGIQKGKPTVAVAVLDTGVAYEDYFDPVTRESFRKAPDWGDTVFLPGFDFVHGDSHPNDDEYHGTHVASTIAEATNNGLGVAGLAFGCAIMPVKVLDEAGEGSFFWVAEGIDYAVDYEQNGNHPVKVINLSLGTESTSATLKSALDRAHTRGVLVVAAAGNSGKAEVEFPANDANVMAVGAVDGRKERAFYSNTGSALDLVAPGGNCDRDDDSDGEPDCVFQQMPDPDYVDVGRHDQFCYCGLDGTSMAAPHVAAAAALLFSQGFTDPSAVKAALQLTAERLGGAAEGGRNDTFGSGLVRPAHALPGMGLTVGPKK